MSTRKNNISIYFNQHVFMPQRLSTIQVPLCCLRPHESWINTLHDLHVFSGRCEDKCCLHHPQLWFPRHNRLKAAVPAPHIPLPDPHQTNKNEPWAEHARMLSIQLRVPSSLQPQLPSNALSAMETGYPPALHCRAPTPRTPFRPPCDRRAWPQVRGGWNAASRCLQRARPGSARRKWRPPWRQCRKTGPATPRPSQRRGR